MKALKDLIWKDGTLSEHKIIVPLSGNIESWGGHEGYVMDVKNDESDFLHAAWIWDDSDKKVVAVVFDPEHWTRRSAKKWVVQAKKLSETGDAVEVIEDDEDDRAHLMSVISSFLEDLSSSKVPAQPIPMNGVANDNTASPEPQSPQGNVAQAQEEREWTSEEAPIAFSLGGNTVDSPYQTQEGIWKCVWKTGKAIHPITHQEITVTPEMLQSVASSFGKAIPYVDIPNGHHFDDPSKNTGYVRKVELRASGSQLWALLEFTEPEFKEKVLRKTIPDVSVMVVPNVKDQQGNKHQWALWHVALTTKPVMQGMASFSVGDIAVEQYEQIVPEEAKEVPMELTAEQQAAFAELVRLQFGVTPEQIAQQREQLERQNTQMLEFAATNRGRRIREIVQALEGKVDVDGVTRIDGYRHVPAVVSAVKEVLETQPQALQMSVSFDGNCSGLDEAILKVVNAIPESARERTQALEFGAGNSFSQEYRQESNTEVSDADIEALVKG